MDIDKLLGLHVITGDGREWVVSSVIPGRPVLLGGAGAATGTAVLPTMARLLPYDAGSDTTPPLDLPLSLLISALDYGLLEQV